MPDEPQFDPQVAARIGMAVAELENFNRRLLLTSKQITAVGIASQALVDVARHEELMTGAAVKYYGELAQVEKRLSLVRMAGIGAFDYKIIDRVIASTNQFSKSLNTSSFERAKKDLADTMAEAKRLGLEGRDNIASMFAAGRGDELKGRIFAIGEAQNRTRAAAASGSKDLSKYKEHEISLYKRVEMAIKSSTSLATSAQIEGVKKFSKASTTAAMERMGPSVMGSKLGQMVAAIPGMEKVMVAEKMEAQTGERMGLGMSIASRGIGAFLEKVSPLVDEMQIISSVAAVGAKAIKLFIEAFDGMRKTGGMAKMATAARGGGGATGPFGFDASLGSLRRIQQASGLTVGQIIRTAGTFNSEIVGMAQGALFQFGNMQTGITDDVDAWAGALAGVAVQGKRFNMDYGRSIGIAITATKAFNLQTGPEAKKAFEDFSHGFMMARLSADDFSASLGDVIEMGTKFGDQRSAYLQMGRILGSLGMSQPQRVMMGQVFAGMSSNITRLIGMTQYAHSGGLAAAMKEIQDAAASGKKPGGGGIVGFDKKIYFDVFSKMMGGKAEVEAGLKEGADPQKLLRASLAASATVGGTVGEKLTSAMISDPTFKSAYRSMAMGEKLSKDQQDAIDRAMGEKSLEEKGVNAMVSQKGIMEQLLGMAQEAVKMLAIMATPALIGGGDTAETRMVRRIRSSRIVSPNDTAEGNQMAAHLR